MCEDNKELGASPTASDRATPEQSPQAVSALRGGIADADAELLAMDRAELLLALHDAKLQLCYLDSRWPTGTTPTVITRIERALDGALPWAVIAQAIEARSGETRQGLDPKDESAVSEADAPVTSRQNISDVLIEALEDARAALHQHYVDWDGEPEDAVPLQLARSKCDDALRQAKGGRNGV